MPLVGNVSSTQAIYGSSTPTNDIGADDDIYVQSSDARISRVWKKESGIWNAIGSTTNVTSGTAAPNDANGNQGDVYLKVDTNGVVLISYQKLSGAWAIIGDINSGLNTFVSTASSQGGTITTMGSVNVYYRLLGNKLIFIRGFINVVDRGTATGFLTFTLPPAYVVVAQGGVGTCRESSVGNVCDLNFMSSQAAARINKYDGTTVFTANNVFYTFSGIYEFI